MLQAAPKRIPSMLIDKLISMQEELVCGNLFFEDGE